MFTSLWFKLGSLAVIIAAAVTGFFALRQHFINEGYNECKSVQKKEVQTVVKIQTKVIHQIEKVYVPQLKIIHEVGKTITKEVPIYVTAKDNGRCTINNGFVRLWNSANRSVPITQSSTDETPSAVVLSDVASEHSREAELCNATTLQLNALITEIEKERAAVSHQN